MGRTFLQPATPLVRLPVFGIACALICVTGTAHAANGTWTGAAGATWTTTATNWSNVTGTPWDATNGPSNVAVFNTVSATPTVSGTVWASGLTFSQAATVTGGAITLTGGTANVNTANNGVINSVVTGSATLAKLGTAVLVLNGTNTYTGGTVINGGRVSISNPSALGSGDVNIAANLTGLVITWATGNVTGTVANNFTVNCATSANAAKEAIFMDGGNGGNAVLTGSVTLSNAASSIGAYTGQSVTITGKMTGTGGLNKGIGGGGQLGTLILSNSANDYSGNTTVVAGTLRLGASNALPFGAGKGNLILNGGTSSSWAGTFDLNGFNQTVNGLSGTSNTVLGQVVNNATGTSTLTVGANDTTSSFAGQLADGGVGKVLVLAKTGTGTLTLSGSNSFSGGVTASGGLLTVGQAFALGTGPVTVSGGELALGSYSPSVGSFAITSGSLTGSGTLTGSTYSLQGGAVNANLGSGTVNVTANSSLNGTSAAATLNLNSGTLTLGSGGSRFTSSSIAVTGSSGASILLGGNEAFGSLAGAANVDTAGFTLSTSAANTSTTYSGNIAGAGGAFTKLGSGTFTLSGSNSYTGLTTLSGGVLALGGTNALAGGGNITFAGGTMQFSSSNLTDFSARIKNSGSAIAIDTNAQNVTFASVLDATNTGGLVKNGSGILGLSGTNTYAGGTVINAGGLGAKTPGVFGSGDVNVAGNGAYVSFWYTNTGVTGTFANNFTINSGSASAAKEAIFVDGAVSGNVVLTGSVTLSNAASSIGAYNGNSITITGKVTGTGGLVKGMGASSNVGTLVLSNTGNDYAGNTTVNSGVLRLGASNVVPYGAGKGNLVLNGGANSYQAGTLDLNGFNQTVNGLSGTAATYLGQVVNNATGTSTLTVGANDTTSSFAGQLADGGVGKVLALTKTGSGNLTLTGSNTYSGTTTVSVGNLIVGAGGTAGTLGTGPVVTNSLLIFDRSDKVTFGNTTNISGNGTIQFGNSSGVSQSYELTGGSMTASGNVYVGGQGGAGTTLFTVSGGTVSTGRIIVGVNSSGTLANSGGSVVTTGNLNLGWASTANGVYSQTSSAAVTSVANLQIINASVLSIGGGSFTATAFGLFGGQANNQVQMILSGGTTTLPAFPTTRGTNATATVTFDGGVLRPSGASTTYLQNLTNAYLTNNGAIFDTNGNDITVAQALVDGTAAGTAGILTKRGNGTLTLSGSNTYTGLTTISAGILSFGGTSGLQGTSGLSIAGGAGLTYTGGAASFGKNITVSSGTGTVRNSGSGLLTLGGTLTKNGTVLRLTGGQFNVTGQIVGANSGSDLLVDGTSTVTLSNTNTYNGPTFVNQSSNLIVGVDNAIPNGSIVTLGNGSTRGTLTLGSVSDSISQLVFSGSGGTLSLSGDKTNAVQLATNDSLTLGSNASLVITSTSFTQPLYRLISFTSLSGTFAGANVTGTPTNYRLLYSGTEIGLQQNANQTLSLTPASSRVLVGGSTTLAGTLVNTTGSGGASLAVNLTSAGTLTGTSFASSSGSTVAAGGTSTISATLLAGNTAGSRNWSVVNTDSGAITTTATSSGSITVVNQRSFAITGGTIALGNFLRTASQSGSSTVSSSGLYDTTANASLASFTGTNTNGFSLSLASGSANFAGAEATQQAVYSLSGSAASAGSINGSFSSSVTAEFGSISPLSVLVTGTALDPATAQLAYGGTVVGTNWTINLGEFNVGSGTSSPFSFGISNLEQTAGFTADLYLASLTNPTNSGAIFTDLTGTSAFATLAAGGTNSFSAWMSLSTTGTFTNIYNLSFNSSKNGAGLGGTPQNVTLTVTGIIVVPEPGAMALAVIGAGLTGWMAWKRRRPRR